MIRLLLMIVICAGMNALLPHDSPVGETWIVSGISECELFNGSECEDPTCNRNCQFLRCRRPYRLDLSDGMSLVGQICGCERFNMSQQIPSPDLNV